MGRPSWRPRHLRARYLVGSDDQERSRRPLFQEGKIPAVEWAAAKGLLGAGQQDEQEETEIGLDRLG
jgi:hypothetical protein